MSAEERSRREPAPAPPAAAADRPHLEVRDPKMMRALAHPLRVALLEAISQAETRTLTATEASDLLGESPANCAFHLRTLAKYGFVREAGGGKGRERPWALVNRSVRITADQPDPQAALAADELSRLFLERWIDRARRAYGSSNEIPGWERASGWTNVHIFLTPDETARLRDEMCEILDRYEGRLADPALRPDGASPVEWTIFATPVPELAQPTEPGPVPDDRGASRSTGQEDQAD